MLANIRNLFYLVDFPVKAKLIFSVIGAFAVSLLEIAGVLATYPLLLLASGQPADTGILAFVSNILGRQDRQQLILYVAGAVIAAFIVKAIFTLGFRWWQIGFINEMEKSARTTLLRSYLDAPYADHKKQDLSKIHTTLASAVGQAYSQTIFGGLSFMTSVLTIIMMVLVTLFISPVIALFAFCIFAGVGYVLPMLLRRKLIDISHLFLKADHISWFASMPALEAFREMRLFAVGDRFVEKYAEGASLRAVGSRQQGVINELPKNIMEIVFVVSIAGLAIFLFSTKDQAEAVATMGVFTVAAVRVMPAVNSAIASLNAVRVGASGVTTLNREIAYFKNMESYSELPSSGTRYEGDVEVQGVTFKYSPDERSVLDKVSITIPARRTVAFVGSSGSGKSTLVDIVLGMLKPTSGRVLCGGNSIHDDLKSWQSQLGVVPQSVYVLPGSLKLNVAFGLAESEIDEQRVHQALQHAELGDLLSSLPQGIDEDLGQDGSRLSGGQRQRLGIARALYRNPSLLVLDEATSALDNKTEHKITQTIDRLSGEMTIIMVAHRLSTIRKADVIYYMKNGKIIDQGSFEELIRKVPEFEELVNLGKL
ncbi:hypothetical protein A7979_06780 [Rothia nasimurium]|uniref:ABC transporter ATP-binding protein n=1 Tax=Rothia nasimurium TaxID=85336 RepID=A0A1Y1RN38_9MICC|nr:ABC transporter ATP-binding protein [Rothia nasimurium]ORC15437.1 hypothetical protein A7979_06780 [Rothia nasimurium]